MLFLAAALFAWQAPDVAALLDRVAEEAGLLAQKAPRFFSTETLLHRAVSRPRPLVRAGGAASKPVAVKLTERVIVSEYTVGPLKAPASGSLLEFREVVSVDGRKVQSSGTARHALSLGLPSADDQARKRMLEDFAKYTIGAVATDYALVLLSFADGSREDLRITLSGDSRVGDDEAALFVWDQQSSEKGQVIFAGRETARQPLSGKLWVRKTDGLPLRIWVWAAQRVGEYIVRDEATVDYAMTPHGFVAPQSIHHLHIVEGQMTAENLYTYSPFRLFGADSEIRFQAQPAK
jgi:hypothetical protein